ncbi:bifunctional 3-(3-hydroxy-phenyl)propionate/3-hydroxycinnamic acid hydroxylase [Nocardia pseudovaccinii]|uniref:bifunctional 3-(3-hydroxy-phenyl)propionate/3-hydroxycinnamic acid hydroxylase n=1 Tax=Nocardia pseudovaccinii TaxID=189540 RepID=UPI003D8B1CA3
MDTGALIRTQVAIIGAGPSGVLLANILGNYGVETVVIDRETEIVEYPRAVGMDDESLRSLQSIDLAEDQLADTIQNVPLQFFDRTGRCLADIRPTTREFGWARRNIFLQQNLEKVLRRGLIRFPVARPLLGHEAVALTQTETSCTVRLRGPDQQSVTVTADYIVGADGGRSSVREFLQIPLEGRTEPRKWVVIDCDNDPVDSASTELHGESDRPYVCVHLPHGYRRWEFMLFPGEHDDTMLGDDSIRALLARHVADPSALNIVRARVYTHHARVARQFGIGRVFLVGDAAHLMPPWAGQGLNTGIRDVTNLGWKLAGAVQGRFGTRLLDSYETERKPHAAAMVSMSATLGRLLCPTNRVQAALRDAVLRALGLVPSVRRWVLEMKFKPIPHYRRGALVAGTEGSSAAVVGRMMVQPSVRVDDGSTVKLDDALGDWLAMVGWDCDPAEHLTEGQVADFLAMGGTFFKLVESCEAGPRRATSFAETLVLEDIDGVLRPWFNDRHIDVVILRPDRYVAAAATQAALSTTVDALLAALDVTRAHTLHPPEGRVS